jgi:hypothetical protein
MSRAVPTCNLRHILRNADLCASSIRFVHKRLEGTGPYFRGLVKLEGTDKFIINIRLN